MKFVTKTKAMKEILTKIGIIVAKRTTLPVLTYVLVSARDDGTIRVAGTNLETYFSIIMGADVHETGSICLPYTMLMNAIEGSINNCNLTFDTNTGINGKCQVNNFRILGLDAMEFPPVPMNGGSEQVSCEYDSGWNKFWTHHLYDVLQKVDFAKSINDARPTLQTILLGFRDTGMVATATDGFRIATTDNAPGLVKEDLKVYGKALEVVYKTMKDNKVDSPLRLITWVHKYGENKVDNQFLSAEWKISGKEYTAQAMLWIPCMTDANFPDYHQIMPKKMPRYFTTAKSQLMEAMKGAWQIAKFGNNIVYFAVYPKHIMVYAHCEEVGEFMQKISCESNLQEDEIFVFAANVEFVIEGLDSDPCNTVYANVRLHNTPVQMLFSGFYQYIIMPMHIDNVPSYPTDFISKDDVALAEQYNKRIIELGKAERAAQKEAERIENERVIANIKAQVEEAAQSIRKM